MAIAACIALCCKERQRLLTARHSLHVATARMHAINSLASVSAAEHCCCEESAYAVELTPGLSAIFMLVLFRYVGL
jgi:hypothetical protein